MDRIPISIMLVISALVVGLVVISTTAAMHPPPPHVSCVLAHQVAARVKDGAPQVLLNFIAPVSVDAEVPTYPLVKACSAVDTTRVRPMPRDSAATNG